MPETWRLRKSRCLRRRIYDGPSRALELLNLGGGLPTGYDAGVPALEAYSKAIRESLGQHFPDPPRLIIESGRYLPPRRAWRARKWSWSPHTHEYGAVGNESAGVGGGASWGCGGVL
ncbi:hypothetical protein [Streptomyces sp. C184]|uniref:hypothetical protein n=1 Tax=Streptomyces sp. C184 TaxID=3237121 RepID=UPI0034C62AD7